MRSEYNVWRVRTFLFYNRFVGHQFHSLRRLLRHRCWVSFAFRRYYRTFGRSTWRKQKSLVAAPMLEVIQGCVVVRHLFPSIQRSNVSFRLKVRKVDIAVERAIDHRCQFLLFCSVRLLSTKRTALKDDPVSFCVVNVVAVEVEDTELRVKNSDHWVDASDNVLV